ncbi:MAG TPA: hypothetical protein VMQ93_02455 [Novosphingobium sp.]|nr:hypothetical protein [Novosphingobium sp.]
MAAGKLVLLLVAGGLAGAAFAGMTTGVMRPYRQDDGRPFADVALPQTTDGTALASPSRPSWLDEGMAVLDSPAWPFGHDPGEDDAAPAYAPPRDYEGEPPYGYDPPDDRRFRRYEDERYAGDRWQGDDGRRGRPAYRTFDGYPDASGGYITDEAEPDVRTDRPAPRRDDAASDAASRAADAAQDVMAAERGR